MKKCYKLIALLLSLCLLLFSSYPSPLQEKDSGAAASAAVSAVVAGQPVTFAAVAGAALGGAATGLVSSIPGMNTLPPAARGAIAGAVNGGVTALATGIIGRATGESDQSWGEILAGTAVCAATGAVVGGITGAIGGAIQNRQQARAQAATPAADDVDASSPMGSRQNQMNQPNNPDYQPRRNTETNINDRDYSAHAQDRMQDRGILPSVVENTVDYGTSNPSRNGVTHYYDSTNDVSVFLNDTGKVVTTRYGR